MSTDEDVRAWLRGRGAERIPHAGGNLYVHLCRVGERLGALGCGAEVRAAGLTHAAYGTDGFRVPLLDRTERAVLRDLVGGDAEELVYLYCASDRDRTWPALPTTGQVYDRFTERTIAPGAARLRSLVDLSIVNELDLLEQDPSVADAHGDYFRQLFASWAPLASERVIRDARRVLPG